MSAIHRDASTTWVQSDYLPQQCSIVSITVIKQDKFLFPKAFFKQFDIYKEGINKAYAFDRQISIWELDTNPLSYKI